MEKTHHSKLNDLYEIKHRLWNEDMVDIATQMEAQSADIKGLQKFREWTEEAILKASQFKRRHFLEYSWEFIA